MGVEECIRASSTRSLVCNASCPTACDCGGSVTVGLDRFAGGEDSPVVGCVAAVRVDVASPELSDSATRSTCEDFSA